MDKAEILWPFPDGLESDATHSISDAYYSYALQDFTMRKSIFIPAGQGEGQVVGRKGWILLFIFPIKEAN